MILDLGSLSVKIRADGTEETTKKLDGLKSAVGGIKKVAKIAGAGVVAAGAAISAIGAQAVQAYGDYEQLVGGIETLFGTGGQTLEEYAAKTKRTTEAAAKDYEKLENVQEKMLNRAHNAFETAGMSANTYMETATSFAASLVSSLKGDTEKAADYADRAMIDMADNANKMGTNLESIQNAYQGFAKQNYTMLDNLKLGYGGTKEEMARLIQDASKLKDVQKDLGITVDANSLSFANIVNAISVMQSSMGIAGTTAKEATTTIQGSLGMLKATWENLMVALADSEGNIGEAISDVFSSIETVAKNLKPVIGQVLQNVPELINDLGVSVIQEIPSVMNMILPELVNTAQQLFNSLASAISDNIPTLINTAVGIVTTLVNSIIELAPSFLETGLMLIISLAQGLADALPQLIPSAIAMVLELVDTLLNNIDAIVDAAINLIMGFADGLMEAIPIIVEKAPQIISKLVDAIIRNAPKMALIAPKLYLELGKGLVLYIGTVLTQIPSLISQIVEHFKTGFATMKNVGSYVIEGLWNGIGSKIDWLKRQVKGVVDKIKSWFTGKDGFDEHSPSKWAYQVAVYLMQGLANGVKDDMTAEETLKKKCDNLKNILKEFTSSYDLDKNLASAEYNLWLSNNPNATAEDKEAQQIKMLTLQSEAQLQSVLSINNAYKKQCELTGENSDEAKTLKLELLQAAEAFNKLNNEIDEIKNKKDDKYWGFKNVDELNQMLRNKDDYEQYLNKNKTALSEMGMSDEDIKAIARKKSGYDGITVYQNFYTKTATPSEVYNATKKATNDMEVNSKL